MTRERAEHYLDWVNREIDRLRALDAEGGMATLAVEDRIATRVEWDDVVDRYLAVVAAYDRRRLSRDQILYLFDVSMHLAALVPVLERLRVRQPDPEILARMKLAAAS
jgi:hypothetical protein